MLVFGGLNKRKRYNDLWRFSTNTKTWTCISTEGPCPEPRAHFTATKFFNKIFFFGGYGGNGQVYSDMWVLHITDNDTMRWENITEEIPGNPPSARFDHCAFKYPITPSSDTFDKLVIMGGRDLSSNHNDIHVFDLKEMSWDEKPIPGLDHEVSERCATATAAQLPSHPVQAAFSQPAAHSGRFRGVQQNKHPTGCLWSILGQKSIRAHCLWTMN